MMTKHEQLFQEFRNYNQKNKEEQVIFWKQNAENVAFRNPEEKQEWQNAITDNLLEIKIALQKLKQTVEEKQLLQAV